MHVGGLGLQYNKLQERIARRVTEGGRGEAAKQVNSTKRTTREEKGDPSEFARREKTNASIRGEKLEIGSILLLYSLREQGQEKTNVERVEPSAPSCLGDVRERRVARDVTRIIVQLGRER